MPSLSGARLGGFAGVEAVLPDPCRPRSAQRRLPDADPPDRALLAQRGKNNTLPAGPDDPGSPWAIGAAEGGHDAVHPEPSGRLPISIASWRAPKALGLEIAIDLAIQCSPDHPWLTEHPEWFHHRPDGTIKYAENPPKRYQDIVNVNWESEDRCGLWEELRRVVLYWVDHGITVFRVDNPHTKPLPFWEWLIGARCAADHPDAGSSWPRRSHDPR